MEFAKPLQAPLSDARCPDAKLDWRGLRARFIAVHELRGTIAVNRAERGVSKGSFHRGVATTLARLAAASGDINPTHLGNVKVAPPTSQVTDGAYIPGERGQ